MTENTWCRLGFAGGRTPVLLVVLGVVTFSTGPTVRAQPEASPGPQPDQQAPTLKQAVGGPPVVSLGLGSELDRQLRPLAADGFGGVVVVARGGRVELAQGYGWASAEQQIPWTPDTVFDIGSLTKQFTSAAVLRLVQEHRLSLDDTLGTFFPSAPAEFQAITLHQLLTHTAGLAPDLGDDYEPLAREAFLARCFATPLRSPPGKEHHYSNVGYSLLAALIELTCGESYETALSRLVLTPAELHETGYRLPNWPAERLAHGYRLGGHWGVPNEKRWSADGPYWNLRGNGGLLSTAWDLVRWHQAMQGDRILADEARRLWRTPHVPEGPRAASSYGYGWTIAPTGRGTTLVWHNGGNGVFYADFRHYVEEDVLVIYATNLAEAGRFRVQRAVDANVFPRKS